LAAVNQDGLSLQYVKEQTHELCLAAVKQNGLALHFVKEQTHEICLASVKNSGYVLLFDIRRLRYMLDLKPSTKRANKLKNQENKLKNHVNLISDDDC
jgi:hypothetical protein